MPDFVRLYVIVNTLQPPEALQELVGLVCIMQMREVLPFDVETLRRHVNQMMKDERRGTYYVFEPPVLRIAFVTFVTTVAKNGLDFIFFLILDVGIYVIAVLRFVIVLIFFKVLNVVDVVGDLSSPAGNTDLIGGGSGLLLLLVSTRTIFGIGV